MAILANLPSHEGLAPLSLLDVILMIIIIVQGAQTNNYLPRWLDGKYNDTGKQL